MSETEIELYISIVNSSNLLEILLCALCLVMLFYPNMTERREQGTEKLKKTCIVIIIYAFTYLIGYLFSMYSWISMIVVVVLLVMASRYLSMEKYLALFLGILFFSVRYLGGLIAETLGFIISRNFPGSTGEDFLNTSLNYFITAFMRISICFLMILFIEKIWNRKRIRLNLRELCYLCLMPVMSILFAFIILRMFAIRIGETFIPLYAEYPEFTGLVPIVVILLYAGIIAAILFCRNMVKMQEEKQHFFVEEQQVHAMQERMDEVEQFYQGIRRMKHEMRNHLTNIKGLAESGKYEDIKQYITQMDESLNMFEFAVRTGHAVTDVIVSDKKKAADKLGITFQSEFY